MLWLIVPLLLVVFLALAGFRKSALAVLVITTIAGAWVYRYNAAADSQAQSSYWATRVSIDKVNVRRTFDATYEISGRITSNLEDHRIDRVGFRVSLRDCAAGGECRAAGVATADVAITLLAGETRDFVGTLYYGKGHVQPKGKLAWDYEITAIRARRQ